jgi:hypothetical protein
VNIDNVTFDDDNRHMSPEAALQKQREIYESMTPEQRVRVALSLEECAWDLARAGIRNQFPEASPDQVEEKLAERIARGRATRRGFVVK